MAYYIASDRFGNYDLCHHGILGQKWGVRRYQNKDGSLTAAGKKHYTRKLDKAMHKERSSLLKTHHRQDDEDYSGGTARRQVRNKITSEFEKSKERLSELEAQKAYNKSLGKDNERDAEKKFYDAHFKSNKKFAEIGQKYYRELAQAYLKDYKLPDSKEYVDLAEEHMRKHKWGLYV